MLLIFVLLLIGCVCVRDFTCACMLLVSVVSVCSESSTSSPWVAVSGSVMKPGFSCRIHFLYTLITFLVADASQDGSRKALGGRTWNFNLDCYSIMSGFKGSLVVGKAFMLCWKMSRRGQQSTCYHSVTIWPVFYTWPKLKSVQSLQIYLNNVK